MTVHLFGIRHHGPGCARSLIAALTALDPDILLVEGPPDADPVLPLIIDEALQPPVALLVYDQDQPRQAVFYPMAAFSPEWQAIRFALKRNVPTRLMDLPQALRFSLEEPPQHEEVAERVAETTEAAEEPIVDAAVVAADPPATEPPPTTVPTLEEDPIGALAEAAGYADRELWWEDQVERRNDPTDLFASIFEAMAALRADVPPAEGIEALREAHMRQAIRAAEREGFQRIAVVCGAWHAPVLVEYSTANKDAALLAGKKRTKTAATWVPWTNSRLAYRSGYGAGIESPGWYSHLWEQPDNHAIHWVTKAARALRKEDLDAPSSNVIEAVRLADALAAIRARPVPGLQELREAIQTTLCGGNFTPMELIRDELEVGDILGTVPDTAPAVPLQRDIETIQRRLRMRPTAEIKPLSLDLRQENDRARSHFLHRLVILGVHWGSYLSQGGAKSTFAETWQMEWKPELAVAIIEASLWGNSVYEAAIKKLQEASSATDNLADLTLMLDSAVLASLPEAVESLLQRVNDAAAVAADVRGLMGALPPLARVARYGDVRETKATDLLPIIEGLLARIVVGLPGACASLDDDAASAIIESINNTQESLALLEEVAGKEDWQRVLRQIAERESIHGMVRGRCSRILLDEQLINGAELGQLAGLTLNPVTPPSDAAAWISGVVQGSGLVLIHQDILWQALDGWLRELDGDNFLTVVALLRRAFSEFASPERRAMGDIVRRIGLAGTFTNGVKTENSEQIDRARADRTLPVLASLLGVPMPQLAGTEATGEEQ